ncbi:MAG: nickel pincer cofactor biosynthesis protein LarB, partial [Planctomycetota bacterium]
MKESTIRDLLEQVAAGQVSPAEALESIRRLPFEDIGFAKIDHHRALRCGVPEVVLCHGKTPDHVA